MNKQEAESEKTVHSNLINKVLIHNTYKQKMQVVEIGILEISIHSDSYYVYCRLKGKLGDDVVETLDYVLKHYSVASSTL